MSRLAPPMPSYVLTMSTKIPGQPKALWGVNKDHRSTCILIPEDWRNVDPMVLLEMFDLDNCPSGQAARLRYGFEDHVTAYARALAWFGKWPRSGLEHDNFLGDGDNKPMDASHVCHHDACIIHVAYEPAYMNQERKECCQIARKLRQEEKDIPEHCSTHSPPCLLQHAALRTNEAFSIQFDVLRQARGLSREASRFRRPRRHLFSTFEGHLPCRFPAINVHVANLVTDRPVSRGKRGKPVSFCVFCKSIKAFDTAAGYWGHLVNKHDGIDTSMRLDEIRRTAAEWTVYWEENSDGGKRGHATKQRLEQVKQAGFDWDVVLAWELR